ncbi:hypothetical protein [Flintibacter muris]|uniref:hypothetical protein n=1 Tax=Flintibacter muris TaxID=2941327 RepID=UPI002041F86A|nr:hypothetical protein [Flintibacter muris]
METHDSIGREAESPMADQSGSAGGGRRISIDRFEMNRHWEERTEEEKVEAAAALYEKAARQWMQPEQPEQEEEIDSEELEAMSQQLKLQQKCQDIAALMMAVRLESDFDEDKTK